MINLIRKIFSLRLNNLSVQEIEILAIPRSSKWKKVRNQFLKENPYCSICGSEYNVVPHHIIPVHVDQSKELDFSNLVSLCENKTFNCHFFFGHLKNWTRHNPNILEDIKIWSERITIR